LPLVRFETLYFFDQSPSLAGCCRNALWTGDDPVLAIVVGLVSLVFPVVKMVAITAEAVGLARIPPCHAGAAASEPLVADGRGAGGAGDRGGQDRRNRRGVFAAGTVVLRRIGADGGHRHGLAGRAGGPGRG
jgi:hypothetical protein